MSSAVPTLLVRETGRVEVEEERVVVKEGIRDKERRYEDGQVGNGGSGGTEQKGTEQKDASGEARKIEKTEQLQPRDEMESNALNLESEEAFSLTQAMPSRPSSAYVPPSPSPSFPMQLCSIPYFVSRKFHALHI